MAKAKKTEKEGKAPRAANSGKTNVAWLVCSSVFGLTLGVSLYFWNTLKRTSPRFSRKDSFIMTKTHVDMIRKYRSKCDLSVEKLNQLIKDFQSQMSKGLKKEDEMIKMLATYVEKMPTGSETGEFLAIDLGGTNVRVVKVLLKDRKVQEVVAHEDAIPKELMTGTTKQLFDFIAKQVKNFITKYMKAQSMMMKKKKAYPIGFTFSYPMRQKSINSGELICWTKGFGIKDTTGKCLVELLQNSLTEQKVNGTVFAILNDTVGTLAANKFKDQDTQIGLILGTGSNAAYIERTSRCSKLNRESGGSGSNQMIINMEWGNYKSSHLPYMDVDKDIDASTLNKGAQHYEKMISGMYLGEMARRICLKASKEINLFGGTQRNKLEQEWSFPTSLVSKIDGLGTEDLHQVENLLSSTLNISEKSVTESDARFVAELCTLIGDRSATLAGAGVVAIYKYMLDNNQVDQGQRFVVAVDGGLFEHYPRYPDRMAQTFIDLLGKKQAQCIELVHSPDGSGIGSAVIAAAQCNS